ncbi:MAG: class I SAM-dependent methyltransferase [Chitinophagaceae bacterium]
MLNNFYRHFKKESSAKIIQRCERVFYDPFFEPVELDGWADKQHDMPYVYKWFTYYYHNLLPHIFRLHRQYFSTDNRGFGEDAFHALWFLLFKKYKPAKILEIGVYRGQTLSYFNLLGRYFNYAVDVHGISPLDDSGDTYSGYKKINYKEDIALNFSRFNLGMPQLHKGYSNDRPMEDFTLSNTWDMIYIDGSHDYEIVKSDIEVCLASLKKNGLLVLDDSSLYLDYVQMEGTFKGHPGPSKASDELKKSGRCANLINVGHNRVFIKL